MYTSSSGSILVVVRRSSSSSRQEVRIVGGVVGVDHINSIDIYVILNHKFITIFMFIVR